MTDIVGFWVRVLEIYVRKTFQDWCYQDGWKKYGRTLRTYR